FPDGCVVLLRAYADEARTTLAWDQADHVYCTMALVEWHLAPGASRQATVRTDAAAILGDTLPDGEYWLAAVLRPDGRTVEVPAGSRTHAGPGCSWSRLFGAPSSPVSQPRTAPENVHVGHPLRSRVAVCGVACGRTAAGRTHPR